MAIHVVTYRWAQLIFSAVVTELPSPRRLLKRRQLANALRRKRGGRPGPEQLGMCVDGAGEILRRASDRFLSFRHEFLTLAMLIILAMHLQPDLCAHLRLCCDAICPPLTPLCTTLTTPCRHAVEEMSEAPVLQPLTPLHDFIEKLGRPPDRDALTIYIARLREMVMSFFLLSAEWL